MGLITIVLVALLIGLGIHIFIKRIKFMRLRDECGFDGPPIGFIQFLIGHMYDIVKDAIVNGPENGAYFVIKLHEKYGETFGHYFGWHFAVRTTDPVIMKEVFIKQFGNFTDRENNTYTMGYPLGESLLQIGRDGPHEYGWKEVRSITSPIFTTGKMKAMLPIMHERVVTLIDVLKSKAVDGRINVDVYDEFQALTMDVIGRTAFGVQADSLHDRNDTFYVNGRNFFNEFTIEKSWMLLVSIMVPFLGTICRPYSKLNGYQQIIAKNLTEVVTERRKRMESGWTPKGQVDLIDLLLQQDIIRQQNENKPPMHIDTIVSNCYGFLLAGYETTSTALAFTAWLLAKNPHVQEKLYAEIVEKVGNDSKARGEYDVVMKLPYLDAVFQESLRIRPPVIFFSSRTCVKETYINGFKFTPGTHVGSPVHAIHWDPNLWPNPEVFDPERFIDGKPAHEMAWVAFGVGPRHCVGQRFAEMEYKFALLELIQSFKLELTEKSDDPLQHRVNIVVLRPLNGVHLALVPRD
uniref:Cytochrome P450 n=1 Tax=Panagrellus redivivus TaxID=6233 RepID=A0A7E4VEE3_PANRE